MIDFLITPLAIAAVPVLLYSWYFFVEVGRHQEGWHTNVSRVVLAVDTVCLLLVLVAYAAAPRVHGDYHASMHAIGEYYDKWDRVMVKVLVASFILSFLGKGRLVATLAIASVGLACFWTVITLV